MIFAFFGNFTKELRYFSLNVSVILRVVALFYNFSFSLGFEFLKTLEIEGSKCLEKRPAVLWYILLAHFCRMENVEYGRIILNNKSLSRACIS